MADIELDDLRDCRDGSRSLEIQAVPCMDFQAETRAMFGSPSQAIEFVGLAGRIAFRDDVAIGAGMEFHDGRPEVVRRCHHLDLGLHEQRHPDARVAQFLDGRTQLGVPTKDIEAALGGALLALLRNEAAAWGLRACASPTISDVAAISKFKGTKSCRLRRSMSRSRICRLSSRRCAVMLSAPAKTARWAARMGSG